ncbi:MAG: rhomboid family intramembrane serine protease [Bacteroidota bacterium]|nr:rhomboid family intramembrane serine protease [Bacteroidota bacterium]
MISELLLWVIILITVFISYKGFNDYNYFRKYEFHIGNIQRGEKYRMFSSAFLHADMMHLLFNMLTLFFFAPKVIYYFGNWDFVLIYIISLLVGNYLTFYLYKSNYNYRAVGASGAVTGIVYSAILIDPNAKLYLYFAIPIPAYIFGMAYLLYSIYGMKAQNTNIGHSAHLGGAIAGYLLTLLLYPSLLYNNFLLVVSMAIPILIFIYMMKNNKL